MAQKTIVHKGYHGSIEIDTRDYSLYGKLLFIDEEITYHGNEFAELEARFRQAVERHRQRCIDNGQAPPF